MDNYKKNDNLISNFFYLTNIIGKHISEGKIYDYVMHAYLKYESPTKKEELNFNKANKQLKEVLKIIKDKYDISRTYNASVDPHQTFNKASLSLFQNDDHLLISPYLYHNWRVLIKNEMERALDIASFTSIKRRIIASLQEIKYRSNNSFFWVVEDDLHTNYDYNYFNHYFNEINESINWVKLLKEEDVRNQRIELHSEIFKNKLIKTLINLVKSKRYFNDNYQKHYDLEIKSFIDSISYVNDKTTLISTNYNLSFIDKKRLVNFARVFYYSRDKGLIKATKNQLKTIIKDVFNVGERQFDELTNSLINQELQENKGIAYETDEFIFKPLKKSIN